MKGVLLIGGNGFIGQALARALGARGETVTVLSRRPPPARWPACAGSPAT